MPIESRDVATGTITDAEQLQRELNVAADLIGAVCSGVAIYTGAPDDTIEMQFDVAADDTEIDNVIAAHPSYTPGLVASIALTAGVWATIWTLPLASGERLDIEARIDIDLGDGSDLETETARSTTTARRRTGGAVFVASGPADSFGEIQQTRLRFVASGSFVELQLMAQVTNTVELSGEVTVRSEMFS
jgi:phage tail sheath protein FI